MMFITEIKKQKMIIAISVVFISVFMFFMACSFVKEYKPQILNEVDFSGKTNTGFFENYGIYDQISQRVDFEYVGSYEDNNNNHKAEYRSGWYEGSGDVLFRVQGYANNEDIQFYLELDNGNKLDCNIEAREEWADYFFRIGRKRNFRVIAIDNATGGFDWVAFSKYPIQYGWKYVLASEYIRIYKTFCMLLLVFCWMIPGYIIVIILLHKINRKECAHMYVFFAMAIISLLFYWIRVYTSVDMKQFIQIAWILAICFGVINYRKLNENIKETSLIKEIKVIFIIASFYLVILYAYDLQNGYDLMFMGRRFMPTIDNEFQLELAKRLMLHEDFRESLFGWQTSDRPPLLAAMFYTIAIWVPKSIYSDLYLAQGILMNLSVMTIVLYYIRELSFCKKQIVYQLILFVFNSTVCINMIFVWPKFLSCTFFGISMILLYQWYQNKKLSRIEQCVVGASIAIGMLAHGSIAFAVIGLGLVLLLGRNVRWKEVCFIVISFAIVYAPWMAYQKVIDPPGDILLRAYLGGVWTDNGNTLFEQLLDSYKSLTVREWIVRRVANFIKFFGVLDVGKEANILLWYWMNKWSALFFALGINNIILFNAVLYKKHLNKIQKYLVSIFAMSILIHVLMYFNGGDTCIHQSAYSNIILLFIIVASLSENIETGMLSVMNILNVLDIIIVLILNPVLKLTSKSYAGIFYSFNYVSIILCVVEALLVLICLKKYNA